MKIFEKEDIDCPWCGKTLPRNGLIPRLKGTAHMLKHLTPRDKAGQNGSGTANS